MEVKWILKALANERRLRIIKLLSVNHELEVDRISQEIGLSFKATSKHLVILSKVNILKRRQVSLNAFYQLNDNIHPIIQTVLAHLWFCL